MHNPTSTAAAAEDAARIEAEQEALRERIRALTPEQKHSALMYLTGWTLDGTTAAVDHAVSKYPAARIDGSEPDPDPVCWETRGGYACTQPKGHDGEHVATGLTEEWARWTS